MHRFSNRFLAGAIAVSGVIGCTPRVSVGSPAVAQAADVACAPTVGKLAPGTHMTAIVGEHRLTLVATSGSRAGQSTTGTLRIDPASGNAAIDSLIGTSAISLDAVGATAPGPRGGADVTVTEWVMSSSDGAMTPQITVRFGRIAAPAGTRPIEGAHMALSANTVSDAAFSGTWDSGTGDPGAPGASGYFCATASRDLAAGFKRRNTN